MSDFNKTVDGTTLRFAPTGSITAQNAQQLKDEINESIEGITDIVFDCTNLDYISSAGLRVFLATQKSLEGKGSVRVEHPCKAVSEVFRVTRLSTFVDVIED